MTLTATTSVVIARTFVDTQRNGHSFDDYPSKFAANKAEGYAIQDQAMQISGKSVSGWIGDRVPNCLAASCGSNRIAGCISAKTIINGSRSGVARMPLLSGFAAVEAEPFLSFGARLPQKCDDGFYYVLYRRSSRGQMDFRGCDNQCSPDCSRAIGDRSVRPQVSSFLYCPAVNADYAKR